jgi:hypothetical protein
MGREAADQPVPAVELADAIGWRQPQHPAPVGTPRAAEAEARQGREHLELGHRQAKEPNRDRVTGV